MNALAQFAFASGSTELRQLLAGCDERQLSAWETEFVATMRTRRFAPTPKQWATLRRIAAGAPNYEAIAAAALRVLPDILARWLPDGKQHGKEYTARNPRRADRAIGSFTVNTVTGQWADFAADARGGDVVSLAAYLHNLAQPEAARQVAAMVGLGDEAGA